MAVYKYGEYSPVIGKDCYVSDSARVIGNVVLGDCCYVGHGAIVRGDHGLIEIGRGTAIEESVVIHVRFHQSYILEESVTVAHGAVLHGDRIQSYAVIGMGAVVGRETIIGKWAIVAEGAVVPRGQRVEDEVIVAGVPAKTVGRVTSKHKEYWIWAKQKYVDFAAVYDKELVRLY
jgi:carbonic anhydrase/acetyltransferase-like protein (isoleucine patch superfamily)